MSVSSLFSPTYSVCPPHSLGTVLADASATGDLFPPPKVPVPFENPPTAMAVPEPAPEAAQEVEAVPEPTEEDRTTPSAVVVEEAA